MNKTDNLFNELVLVIVHSDSSVTVHACFLVVSCWAGHYEDIQDFASHSLLTFCCFIST